MSKHSQHLYEFGPFRLDSAERLLVRDGVPVPLTPKAFETLLLLVENSGRLVEKEELMRTLWPDSFVEEANLTNNVWTLRKALSADGNGHEYIKTVPKQGYRFIASVRELPDVTRESAAEKHTLTTVFTGEENQTSNGNAAVNGAAVPLSALELPAVKHERQGRVRSRWRVVFGLLCLLVIGVACLLFYQFALRNYVADQDSAFQRTQVTRLTNTGNASLAAISPDGKYFAYVSDDMGKQSLWISQTAVHSAMQIVPSGEQDLRSPVFTPDSDFLYYVAREKNNTVGTLYMVPVLGGTAKKIIVDVDSPVTFAPDGKRFAFVRRDPFKREDALIIANADGKTEQFLITRRYPEFFYISGGLAWSPDNMRIAAGAGNFERNHHQLDLIGIAVNGGEVKRLSTQKWHEVAGMAWVKDGSALLFAASDERNGTRQLWHLSNATGAARRITNDVSDYRGLSLTADGEAFVTTQVAQHSDIWTSALDAGEEQSRQLTSGKYDGFYGLDWTPQGRIVYGSMASGKPRIWMMEADGKNQRELNEDSESSPCVSPDGRYILFASSKEDAVHIWRMDIDGRNLMQLTNGSGELWQSWTPDGRWIVYASVGANRNTLWKIPADGGAPVQITEQIATKPVVSPDGKLIACVYRAEPSSPWQIAVIPFDGGAPVKIFDHIPNAYFQTFRWTPDGHALSYIATRDGFSNLWRQGLDDSAPQQWTKFAGGQIFSFEWSRDGRQLALARGEISTDAVLIKNLP